MLGLAGIAAVALLGSTLAANISLNGGAGVEFGQGVALTSACDDSITTTPTAQFANAAGAGQFNFTTVAFTNISSACLGDVFTLKAYGDSSATPLNIATVSTTPYNQATFRFTTANVPSAGITTGSWSFSAASSSITLGFLNTSTTTGAVAKLTLESSLN
jgi:hypothetical protein